MRKEKHKAASALFLLHSLVLEYCFEPKLANSRYHREKLPQVRLNASQRKYAQTADLSTPPLCLSRSRCVGIEDSTISAGSAHPAGSCTTGDAE